MARRSVQIAEVAQVRRRFGHRRIHELLRPDLPSVSRRRVYRLYASANLAFRSASRRDAQPQSACDSRGLP